MESFLYCNKVSSSMMEYILRMKTVAAVADPISEWDKIESRCHELTAEVYAKANFFPECLRVCLEGGQYDLGMEKYIRYWKQEGRGEEIYQHEQDFLLTVAYYCFAKAEVDMMEKALQGSVTAKDQLLKFLEDHVGAARDDDDAELLTKMKNELLRKKDQSAD
ncbi:hypothetical protein TorRG33x02_322970 [Trema orientale]|uniref:Uncharacterized protein n=1 Tax=Trema orientale TaxID=63057 RepID=A0A2P5BFF6_TREOI|nr:hypothetical protein TorRG33x02_322970 [Trema orientale]